MRGVILAILITGCMVSGLLLRYGAIASVVPPEKKRKLFVCYAAALVIHAVVLTAYFWKAGPSVAVAKNSGVVFAVLTTGINILMLRNRVRENLFAFGIVIVCNYLLLGYPSYLGHLLMQNGIRFDGFAAVGVYALLLLVTFFPMRKLLKNTVEPFLSMDSGSYWNTTWFIPNALFGMLLVSFPGAKTVESFSSILGGILCATIMILLCWRIAEDRKELLEKQLMESQLTGQKVYYAKLQAKVEEARKTGHDFKHYVQAMRHYLTNDDMEGLRTCCIELTQRLNRVAAVQDVGNSVADAVLYQYLEQAQQEEISVKIQGELNCDWIADMDICVILGNLLDNAIEGCKTMEEDRRLSVSFQYSDTVVCILVQNTYDGCVYLENGEYVSRKRDQLAGVGLKSVEDLCQKYQGKLDVCHDESVFSVNLLLEKPRDEEVQHETLSATEKRLV